MSNNEAEYPTTLGPDAIFKGELKFEKGVRLLGRFEGQVQSGGTFVIAEGANLSGEVKAGSIRIEGHVKGDLHANQKVQLASSGRLEGDITTTRLEVADGAVLIGRCMVGANGNGQVAPQPQRDKVPMMAPPVHDKHKIEEPVGVGVHPKR
jgi:cytoskeletal protein CcmA (bactofilin family)